MVVMDKNIFGSDKYDCLIAGAGLYGAVMARELTDHGFKVLVLEKRQHIGGNCYTEKTDGITVHKYGPHIFHTDDVNIWEYVNRFARFNDFINKPVIVSGDKRYPLPVDMDTFIQLWGISDPEEAERKIKSQAEAVLRGKTPENLEEQAISMTGTEIYEKLIKGYSEKQWGRDCRDLPASIIKRIRISFDHSNDYYGDRYQGIPAEGYTSMIEGMLKGIEVITGMDYDDPEIRKQTKSHTDMVIYTGSIDRYYSYCYGKLEYRSVRFAESCLKGLKNYQDRAVVNYADRAIAYTRVTEHKHFDPGDSRNLEFTIITKEFPEDHNENNEPMYPVCDRRNLDLYKRYKDLADKEPEVHFGGRLGTYRYLDMDDVIASALADSSMIIKKHGSKHR